MMKKSIKCSLAAVLCLVIVVAGTLFFVNSFNEVNPTSEEVIGDSKIKHFTYQDVNNENEELCILLENVDGVVVGCLLGTTDEFVSAREGYLPGYFERPMKELSLNGDIVTFTIYADDGEFYANPLGCAMCLSSEKLHFTKGAYKKEIYENADYFKGLKVEYVLDMKTGELTSYQYPDESDTLRVNKFVRITNAPL